MLRLTWESAPAAPAEPAPAEPIGVRLDPAPEKLEALTWRSDGK